MVGRVWPRHSHRGRPLNSVVRQHEVRLSNDLSPVANHLSSWARGVKCVRRLWIYGSRARGDSGPDSDLDVAVEIDPIGNDESAEVSFISTASQWRSELEPYIPFKLHLQWYDPEGSYVEVQRGVEKSGVLVYERAV
jgi:predicted nucleotidyltransferase